MPKDRQKQRANKRKKQNQAAEYAMQLPANKGKGR